MNQSRKLFLLSVVAGLVSLASADSGVHGPVTGFVVDRGAHSIRPINGLAGASWLANPLSLPFAVQRAVFPPQGSFAVALSAPDGGPWLVTALDAEQPSVSPLPVAVAGVDQFVMTASGSAAAFYSSSRAQLQIVTGLPDGPSVGPVIDLSALPGSLSAMALSADGSTALLAAKAANGGAVFLLAPGADGTAAPRFLMQSPAPAVVAYLGATAALVADNSTNQVFVIRDLLGAAGVFLAAGVADGISGPVGIGVSADGQRVFVANAGSGTVTAHDAAFALPAESLSVPVGLSRLDRVSAGAFLLNDAGNGPLFLLDTSGAGRVYFVPATATPSPVSSKPQRRRRVD